LQVNDSDFDTELLNKIRAKNQRTFFEGKINTWLGFKGSKDANKITHVMNAS